MPKDDHQQQARPNWKRWILITGATDGLGRQLAQELASNAAENFVIVHGRTAMNCQAAVEGMRAEEELETGRRDRSGPTRHRQPPPNVEWVAADFGKLAEVTRMAEEMRLRFPRLNCIIACASVIVPRRIKSQDGLEMTLQINHLAHVVLWNELLPLLEQNSPSRILTVGSMLHNFSIDWTDLNCERSVYDKFGQYSRTKLMNHLATLYIHRLMFKHKKQFQVTANVVDAEQRTERKSAPPLPIPHCVAAHSRLGTTLSASESHLYQHDNALDTLRRLTEDREFEGISGKYFDANGKEVRLGADVSDVRVQDQLWAESKLICNGVLGRRTMQPVLNYGKQITFETAKSMTTTTGGGRGGMRSSAAAGDGKMNSIAIHHQNVNNNISSGSSSSSNPIGLVKRNLK